MKVMLLIINIELFIGLYISIVSSSFSFLSNAFNFDYLIPSTSDIFTN